MIEILRKLKSEVDVKVHFTKAKGKYNYMVKMMTRYGVELHKENKSNMEKPNSHKEAK